MKKILIVLISIITVTIFAMGLSACGQNETIGKPTGFDLKKCVLSWDKVDETDYEISINGTDFNSVETNEVDLNNLNLTEDVSKIYLRAIKGDKVSDVAEYELKVNKLSAPQKPYVTTEGISHETRIMWDEVSQADKYLVKINDGKWITYSKNYFVPTVEGEYLVNVKCKSYSKGNEFYLESDESGTNDSYSFIPGPTLLLMDMQTISWQSNLEYDSFNLWIDGVKVKENLTAKDGESYDLVKNGAITKTGEYDVQIEAISNGSRWSNLLTEVGTYNINKNEIYSFDNRVAKLIQVKTGAGISDEQFHGETGYSFKIDKNVFTSTQINFMQYASPENEIDFRNVRKISYWIYIPRIEGVEGDGIPYSALPGWRWEQGNPDGTWDFKVYFPPEDTVVPFDEWTKVTIDCVGCYDIVFILTFPTFNDTPYTLYIDDICYEELAKQREEVVTDYDIKYSKEFPTTAWYDKSQYKEINVGKEYANQTVSLSMKVAGNVKYDGVWEENVLGIFASDTNGEPNEFCVNTNISKETLTGNVNWDKEIIINAPVDAEGKTYLTVAFWGGEKFGNDLRDNLEFDIFIKDINVYGQSVVFQSQRQQAGFKDGIIIIPTELSAETEVTVSFDLSVKSTSEYTDLRLFYRLWPDNTPVYDDIKSLANGKMNGEYKHYSATTKVMNDPVIKIQGTDINTSGNYIIINLCNVSLDGGAYYKNLIIN